MVPVETELVLEVQIVNANSGVTTKLSVKETDLACWTALRAYAKVLAKAST